MRQWRHLSQEDIDELWEEVCGKMEEELEKYKVEEAKKDARNGARYHPRKWRQDCWARIFSWFRESSFQRNKVMQAGRMEEEDVKQHERMAVKASMMRKMKAKSRLDVQSSWLVSDLLAAVCKKKWLHPEGEDTVQQRYTWLQEHKKKDDKNREIRASEAWGRMMSSAAEGRAGFLHNHETSSLETRFAGCRGVGGIC